MALSIGGAELLGLFLEAFFTGIFFTLACVTLVVQYAGGGGIRGYVIPIICVMLAVSVAHLIVTILTAFDSSLGTPDVALFLSDVKFFVNIQLYTVQTFLGDIILMWRCYAMYSRRIVVMIIPMLGLLGCVAVWVDTVVSYAVPSARANLAANAGWVTAQFAITSATCLYNTVAMILWCAYHARKFEAGRQTLGPFVAVLIESGMLYSIGTLSALITHLTGTNAQFTATAPLPSIVGIIYCMIILQIKFSSGLTHPDFMQTTLYLEEPFDSGAEAYPLPSVPRSYTVDDGTGHRVAFSIGSTTVVSSSGHDAANAQRTNHEPQRTRDWKTKILDVKTYNEGS